jgi:hypothetical protein
MAAISCLIGILGLAVPIVRSQMAPIACAVVFVVAEAVA